MSAAALWQNTQCTHTSHLISQPEVNKQVQSRGQPGTFFFFFYVKPNVLDVHVKINSKVAAFSKIGEIT